MSFFLLFLLLLAKVLVGVGVGVLVLGLLLLLLLAEAFVVHVQAVHVTRRGLHAILVLEHDLLLLFLLEGGIEIHLLAGTGRKWSAGSGEFEMRARRPPVRAGD